MLSTRESLLVERHKWSKMKGWKKLFHTNSNQSWDVYTNIRQNEL